MAYDIQLPNIQGATIEAKFLQLSNYIFQLAQNLDFIVNDLDGRTGTEVIAGGVSRQAPSSSSSGKDKLDKLTFTELKSLIITSADIVEAYSDKIQTMLVKEYIAQSDYGKYVEQFRSSLEAAADLLKATITGEQCIVTPGGEVETININGFIKAGVVGTEGDNPVLGVAIGQSTSIDDVESFSKSVQLASGKLSFFDSTDQMNPVAWISGNMLYIRHAQIVETITLGDYILDATDGIAFNWKGGE